MGIYIYIYNQKRQIKIDNIYESLSALLWQQVLREDSKMECSEIKPTGVANQKIKKVGHSKFYDVNSCIASEKQDIMKPEDYIEEGKLSHKHYFT